MYGLLRSLCLVIAIVAAQFNMGFAGVANAAEVIHKFDSVVQLASDGTLTVTETVRVRAEGRAIRRGIYRDFPMTFTDAGGRVRDVDFTLLGVTRDGKPEPYRTERQSRYLRIYAGDKDVTIANGDHTYVFRYTTARQVRWFDGRPELNWNVTGNFWNFPILSATYRLELAPGERPLRWTAFSGPLGAQGKDWRGAIENNGVLTVETTRALAAGEGLTVVAGLSPSAVDPPNALWYSIYDNRHWIFGSLGFGLVLFYYLAAWRAVGRDPRSGTIIPQFHPPAGVSPALANYIDNWGFGRDRWRAFTAAALALAVRGLIKFDNSGGKLVLTSVKQQQPAKVTLPAGEEAIFAWVKQHDGEAIIDKDHGAAVAAVGGKFTAAIEGESRDKFFRRNLGYAIAGVVMTVAVVIGVLIVGGLQENDIGVLIASTIGSFFLAMFIIPIFTAVFGRQGLRSVFRSVMSFAVFAIFISIFVGLVTTIIPDEPVDLSPVLAFVADFPFSFVLLSAFATLNGLFFYLMRAPTALGRPIMDHLAGLRLYIETAEAGRLNMQAPDITAERFEALLPYAVAMNLEKPWSDAFAAALRRAHPDEAEAMQHYRPGWTSGGNWSGAGFGTAVAATVGSVNSALASAVPVSSGSSGFSSSGGGGGSSGGGGGGGGGGGW